MFTSKLIPLLVADIISCYALLVRFFFSLLITSIRAYKFISKYIIVFFCINRWFPHNITYIARTLHAGQYCVYNSSIFGIFSFPYTIKSFIFTVLSFGESDALRKLAERFLHFDLFMVNSKGQTDQSVRDNDYWISG